MNNNEVVKFSICGVEVGIDETEEIIDLLRTDEDFTLQYFERAVKEKRLVECGVIEKKITSADIIYLGNIDNQISVDVTSKSIWTSEPTKYMLALYNELYPQVGKTIKIKNKKAMWKLITEKMVAKGYGFSSTQIENRFKTLDRGFKEKTEHNKKTGRNRASCEFERDLMEINKSRKNVFPEFLLSSTGEGKTSSMLQNESHISHAEQLPTTSVFEDNKSLNTRDVISPVTTDESRQATPNLDDITPRRKKRSRTILDELQYMENQNTENMAIKKRMLENEEQKLLAYKERTDIMKKRNELLEMLLRENN